MSGVRAALSNRTQALAYLALELYARRLSMRDIEDGFTEVRAEGFCRAGERDHRAAVGGVRGLFQARSLGARDRLSLDGIAERLPPRQKREAWRSPSGALSGRKVLLAWIAGPKEDVETVWASSRTCEHAAHIIRAIEEYFLARRAGAAWPTAMRNLGIKVSADLWPEFKARV